MKKAWSTVLSALVVSSALAGSDTDISGNITVDTRDANRPTVQDVESLYCDRQSHVYFLDGVTLNVEFTANVNWNGKTPDKIRFNGVSQSWPDDTRTYDVGTDFGAGGKLQVVAVAADGTESLPYAANFDVIASPPGIPTDLLYALPAASALKYQAPNFSLNVLDQDPDPVAEDVPIFGGEKIGFLTAVKTASEVQGDGTASASLSVGTGSKMKMAGFSIVPAVTGELNWQYDPGSQIWIAGGYVGLRFDASMSTPPAYVWAVPPIYFRADLEIDNEFQAGIDGWDGDDPLWNFVWDGMAVVDGVAGCGASGIAAIEGYLGGGPQWTVQVPQEPTLDKLGVLLRGGVRVVFFFYTWDSGLLEYEWWLVGGPEGEEAQGAMQTMSDGIINQLNQPDGSTFALMSRNYLQPKKSRSLRGGLAEGGGSSNVTVIQANVYPYSDAALDVGGTNRLLVWIHDNTNRIAENRTELISQPWDGANWGSSSPIWDDGTADFSPELSVWTDGTAVVTWQNEGVALTNGATLDDAFAGGEIAVGAFDPQTGVWSCSNLTDNSYLDHSPHLSLATNGLGLLSWVSNPSNSPLGNITNRNSVAYAAWDGTNWSGPGIIATNLRMLLWSSLAYDGNDGVWVGAIDTDDDQGTITNQELYASLYDGADWGALVRLTTNMVQDTRPQVVYDSSGALLIAWYRDGEIMTDNDLDLADAAPVGTVGGTSAARDFTLVTGPDGQVSMLWEGYTEEGSGPDPFMLNYDPTLQTWSDAIPLLDDDYLERSFSGTYSSTGSLLLAYNKVDIPVDTNGIPAFSNQVVDLLYVEYLIGGDLGVDAADMVFSTNPVPGQTVDVSVAILNLGELAATNVLVAFYDGNPSSGGTLIDSTQTVAGILGAGTSAVVQVSWNVPGTTSNRTVYVVVDPDLALEDRNRANNSASLTVMAADLEIGEMAVVRNAVDRRMINARVMNTGVLPSDKAVGVVFHRGSATGTIVQAVQISALATGAQYDANFEWDLSGETFTKAYELVYAVVDETNEVAEADETNNTHMVSVITTLDTDGDGLLDGDEQLLGTSTNIPDTDGDGLNDGDEVHTHATDPTVADTDGDGLLDGAEYGADTDPHNTNSFLGITGMAPDGGYIRVYWQGGVQATQWLERSRNPGATGAQWKAVFTNVPPTSTTTNTLDVVTTNRSQIYRIKAGR